MNTVPKSRFSVSAQYLGPVFSLDGELTKSDQNLIFARNGTGKSFLSRAFRYLDLHCQQQDISDAAFNLVSDESNSGTGSFSFSRGTDAMGRLGLTKAGDNVSAEVSDTIFHVFSEDFVHDELRERKFELDGQIENQIAVDSENIILDDARKALETAQTAVSEAHNALKKCFAAEKAEKLHEKAGINKQLREYKVLDLGKLLETLSEKPSPPEHSIADVLKDLDSLKAIPAEPVYPDTVSQVGSDDIDLEALTASLQKVTSPSSVSEEIKKKIDAHHEFYEEGARIVREEHRSTCPFCEQVITFSDTKAVIDAYLDYFQDEEEKHKCELRDFFKSLRKKEGVLDQTETQLAKQKSRYDDLKRHLPSKKDTELDDVNPQLCAGREAIKTIKSKIEEKAATLAKAQPLPDADLAADVTALNVIIEDNNEKTTGLNSTVGKADEERKALQRKACAVFEREFAIDNWKDIDKLRTLRDKAKTKQGEVKELEKSSPSTDARDRVAETFELLLREFFAEKYVFDKDKFLLKRGDHEMVRGPHRTLSDGE